MRFTVEVKPNAKETRLISSSANHWTIALHAPANEGKANKALINFIAESLSVAKSRVRIVRGATSRQKLIDVQ